MINVSYHNIYSVLPTFVLSRRYPSRRINVPPLFHLVMAYNYLLANKLPAETCGTFRKTVEEGGSTFYFLQPAAWNAYVMTDGEKPYWTMEMRTTP